MLLSDGDLCWRGQELVSPFNPARVQPASIDLSLGKKLMEPSFPGSVDLRRHHPADLMRRSEVSGEGYRLIPGAQVLGHTAETVRVPNTLAARVEGKSTLGRIFLMVHVTAGWCDPGFEGEVTLEIVNLSPWPIILWQGMPIAQVSFYELTSPAMHPYGSDGLGSHYQGQTGATVAVGKRGTL